MTPANRVKLLVGFLAFRKNMEKFLDIIAFHLWISFLFFYKMELRNEAFKEITRHEAQWLLELLKEIFHFWKCILVSFQFDWFHTGVCLDKKKSALSANQIIKLISSTSFPGPFVSFWMSSRAWGRTWNFNCTKRERTTTKNLMISRKFAQNVGMIFIKQSHNGRKPLIFM